MTSEQKRIAIAEACGWMFNASCDLAGKAFPECWTHDDYPIVYHDYELPDYLNDLNAMHDAVKSLPQNIKPRYFACLCAVVSSAITLNGYSEVTEATAAQRAEAFGKTLNLW